MAADMAYGFLPDLVHSVNRSAWCPPSRCFGPSTSWSLVIGMVVFGALLPGLFLS